MLCSSCEQQKANLKQAKSKLWPGTVLHLCESCTGMEPRAFIIIVARTVPGGIDMVRPYITKHKYVGDTIKASDLL